MKLPNKINALKNAVHPTDIKFFRINQLSKTIYSWLHYTYLSVAYSYEKVIIWTGDLKSIWCLEKHFDFWVMYPIFRWKGTSYFILWRNPSTNFGSFVTINRRKRSKCYSLFIMTFIWHWKKSFPDRKRVIEYYLCLWKKQIVVVESRSIFFFQQDCSFTSWLVYWISRDYDWGLTERSTIKYRSAFKTLILPQLPNNHSFQG